MDISEPIFVIDFEGCERTGIVEYGVVELRRAEVVATHTGLCQPREALRQEDTRLHGLDDRMVAGAEPFGNDLALWTGWRCRGPFAAHQAAVEQRLLSAVWPYPSAVSDFAAPGRPLRPNWGPWLDTRYLYERLYPGLNSYKLTELTHRFGLREALESLGAKHCPAKRVRAHCALFDALASALLLARLFREPSLAQADLPWLLALSVPKGGAWQHAKQAELEL